MILSPVDKMFEFGDEVVFYNMIINKENFDEDPLIMRIIRKGLFLVLIINQKEENSKQLIDVIAETFKFKLAKYGDALEEIYNPRQDPSYKSEAQNSEDSWFPNSQNKFFSDDLKELKRKTSIESDLTFKVTKGEIGKVIIQNYKTVYPISSDRFTIDYILFWLANEDMRMIENWYNNLLLNEINSIQSEWKEIDESNKIEFLSKIELVENHLINADNAKTSKSKYYEKIISSSLASVELRYLIRHLISRMSNLDNTENIIERKIELAKSNFHLIIDTKTSDASSALNNQMRMFTLLSLMFLPLNVITGMWGMNCKVPFIVDEADNLHAFYTLTAIMIFFVMLWFIFYKLKGWI